MPVPVPGIAAQRRKGFICPPESERHPSNRRHLSMRLLTEADRMAVEAFLLQRVETSMILLSNLRAAGFVDQGQRYQGTWVGAFEGEALVAVTCHAWNGNLLLQAPVRTAELAAFARATSRREVRGALGPLEQVSALQLEAQARRPAAEILFTLETTVMSPPQLARHTRLAEPRDLEQLAQWRYDYVVELNLEPGGEATRRGAAEGVRAAAERRDLFVLELDGRVVATTMFNARLPEVVQIGGVFCPPALRSRGYARAAVAGSLQLAAVPRAVLFTSHDNHAAQRAYRALGFREAGTYGLLLL